MKSRMNWYIPYGLAQSETLPAGAGSLLKRADTSVDTRSTWVQLANALSLDRLPFAAMGARFWQLPEDHVWLRADPVVLRPDHAGIYVLGSEACQLTLPEAEELAAELNAWLKQDGMVLHVVNATQWYLQIPKALVQPDGTLGLQTQTLARACGADLQSVLPTGTKALAWQSRLMEWQMLLDRSACNVRRQQQGKPVVNSIWLWGESGAQAKIASSPAIEQGIWLSDSVMLTDWLRESGATGYGWSERESVMKKHGADNISIIYTACEMAAIKASADELNQARHEWLTFLRSHLARYEHIIRADNQCIYRHSPWQRWLFWR